MTNGKRISGHCKLDATLLHIARRDTLYLATHDCLIRSLSALFSYVDLLLLEGGSRPRYSTKVHVLISTNYYTVHLDMKYLVLDKKK